MVIRNLSSAVRLQKVRPKFFWQIRPMRPTCAHALSWSRNTAAYTAPRALPIASENTQFCGWQRSMHST